MELPARPSRKVLTIGMPPATEASKASAAPFSSASKASRIPCLASSALLAVTKDLPLPSAASAAASAAPSSPPISSTKRSILGERARATQSSNQAKLARSIPRCFSLWQAETPAIAIFRPVRRRSASAWRLRSVITAAPTVPRPAMPMRKGGNMDLKPAKPEGGRR